MPPLPRLPTLACALQLAMTSPRRAFSQAPCSSPCMHRTISTPSSTLTGCHQTTPRDFGSTYTSKRVASSGIPSRRSWDHSRLRCRYEARAFLGSRLAFFVSCFLRRSRCHRPTHSCLQSGSLLLAGHPCRSRRSCLSTAIGSAASGSSADSRRRALCSWPWYL